MKPEDLNFRPTEEQLDNFTRKLIPRVNALIESKANESYDGLVGIKWKDIAQKEWLTSEEASFYLNISTSTLSNYTSAGKLSFYKRDRVLDIKIKVTKKKKKKNSKSPMGSGGYGFREFHIEDLINFREKYNRRIQSELDDI